jgi:hypothetical protein
MLCTGKVVGRPGPWRAPMPASRRPWLPSGRHYMPRRCHLRLRASPRAHIHEYHLRLVSEALALCVERTRVTWRPRRRWGEWTPWARQAWRYGSPGITTSLPVGAPTTARKVALPRACSQTWPSQAACAPAPCACSASACFSEKWNGQMASGLKGARILENLKIAF